MTLDALAQGLGVSFDREKHQGLFTEAVLSGEKVLLLKPMTFMNRSGDCVAPFARQKAHEPENVLVIVDDVHLPLGRIRMRPTGSPGGHNGLKSLIERLGSDQFPRLRMGVGTSEQTKPLPDHVLGRFHPDEFDSVNEMVTRAVKAAGRWVEAGPVTVMNEFNG